MFLLWLCRTSKEGCPYSVKATLSTSTPEQDIKFGEEEVDVMASENSQETRTSNVKSNDEYGPWVLVRQMRVGQKGSDIRNPSKKKVIWALRMGLSTSRKALFLLRLLLVL